MELFDIIKSFYGKNRKKWNTVTKNEKNKNFFMINRIMAIGFPELANQFNKLRINPYTVVDWWSERMNASFSRTPEWIYTKTSKKSKESKSDKLKTEEAEELIRNSYSVSKRDLQTLKSFYPDKYKSWIKDINDQLGIK
jgi:hypothetical protein